MCRGRRSEKACIVLAAMASPSTFSTFFCFLALFLPALSAHSFELPPDALTLVSFKASLSDPLNHLSSWSPSSSNLSSWFGVSFSVSSSVISIVLPSCNLSGPLSPVLGNLSSLQYLQLADNNLTGVIPSELYGLPSLTYLNLSFNWLSGTIPRGFQRMVRLQVLDLDTNCLTGSIPDDIANSTELLRLDLGGNSLAGALPWQLGTLVNLINFTASGNAITGEIPSLLGNLTKLQWLFVGWNKITGKVPSSLGNLQDLSLLDLSNNLLYGSIPSQLGNLKSLTILRLYTNELTGRIPPQLANLTKLQFLDLAMNKLEGGIPTEFANLSSLELIHLNSNNLAGTVPDWLAELPHLYSLYLFNNSLSGALPGALGLTNPKLEEFDVSQNMIHGVIPPHLCWGNGLKYALLFSNQISGPIPSDLLNCPSLIRLRLENNLLSGSLPKISTPPLSLQYLGIFKNSLTGNIPPEIGNVSSLRALLIEQNQFDGELPMELQNLQLLKVFRASQNKFVGSFPLQVCTNKPSLYDLELDSNDLTGVIPSKISMCAGLQTLYLSNNRFEGSIPEELGKLPSLGYLDISQNGLSGHVPGSLSSSLTLVSINISFNNLVGPLPADGVFRNLTESDFEGNVRLCGSMQGLQPCLETISSDTRAISFNSHGSKKSSMLSYVLPILCLLLLLLLLASIILLYQKCKKIGHMIERQASCNKSSFWKITMFQSSRILTYEDIWFALKEENVIGNGGSGKVYKGETRTGEAFVVKKLHTRYSDEESGSRGSLYDHGYHAEVETLGRIRHRNIVQLLCSCVMRDNDLLVYEYMPNGSLADVLDDKGKLAVLLGWDLRFRIAVEVAQALSYLHHDCVPQILHRDIKSHNILLDEHFTAHLSDFGLAKHYDGVKNSATMSLLAGSCGYIAPECAYTLKVNDKCDVFSFGVVLLELISGRKPLEIGLDGQIESLVAWINKKMIESAEEMMYVVDSRLGILQNYAKEECFWLLKVALKCTSPSSYCRPSMKEVVQMLVRPKIGDTSLSLSSSFKWDLNKLAEK